MSGSLKLGIILIVGVIVLGFTFKLLVNLIGGIISLLMPLAFVAGIGLILYALLSRKALGGGRRYLP
jgi:hypothetical protein